MRNIYVDYFQKATILIILPIISLSEDIERYTIYQNHSENFHDLFLRALPNGRVTLFMHLNDNKVIFHQKEKNIKLSNFITGIFEPDKTPYIKPHPKYNLFKGIAVTFTYRGVHNLLRMPLIKTTNTCLEFESVFGNCGDYLIERINQANSNSEIIKILNSFFLKLSEDKSCNLPKDLHNISDFINYKQGRLSLDDISHSVNLSYKSMYRLFNNHIGIGPKTFLKILRFNQACRLLRYKPRHNWNEMIYHCGYYDQSHFIKEFKFFMKESPHQFLHKSEGHFYYNRPFTFK